jgi:hypothetical protein
MGYIVSRDCSISVTVSCENTKNFSVKCEGKKYCLSFQDFPNTFQQSSKILIPVRSCNILITHIQFVLLNS